MQLAERADDASLSDLLSRTFKYLEEFFVYVIVGAANQHIASRCCFLEPAAHRRSNLKVPTHVLLAITVMSQCKHSPAEWRLKNYVRFGIVATMQRASSLEACMKTVRQIEESRQKKPEFTSLSKEMHMLKAQQVTALAAAGRSVTVASKGDPALGPLSLLPGVWRNMPNLPGRGWNMIALPCATLPGSQFPFNYRLLMNQYNEQLTFTLVDKAVPNRGINRGAGGVTEADQFVVTLDYEQVINQIVAEDAPVSNLAGPAGAAIHHEPGLWLHMLNEAEDGLDIARLASVPHGDSVLALGRSCTVQGPPVIPVISGLPLGVNPDIENNPYLGPYKAFHGNNKFRGLFDPATPNDLLAAANQGVNIVRTTILDVDSDIPTGGISNIPFIVKQANATTMRSTFWIQELAEKDKNGDPVMRLQYSQTVMLDFFPRADGNPGQIRWPHISINTLEKVADVVL